MNLLIERMRALLHGRFSINIGSLVVPSRSKIKGSGCYSLFVHAWLPRIFCGTWKLLYMTLCCTIVYHWITRVFTRMPSVRSVKALSLYLRQTYAHHFSSLLPEISVPGDLGDLPAHLEYWTVHDLSCIKCGKTERHSNVVAIACHWRYLLNITPVLLSASSAYMSQ